MILMAGNHAYQLVYEHKNAWNAEAFRDRYSEVLERYDYIVGDWGYNQLRLKGFYRDQHPKASKDSMISSLVDYINEYCNFGCAYFVLAKLDPRSLPPGETVLPDPAAETATTAALSAAAEAEAGGAAEPAAASAGGRLMRWPLKERPGGPGKIPGTSPAAISRAAAENAERKQAAAAAAGQAASGRTGSSAKAADGPGWPQGGGGERRGGGQANRPQGEGRSGKPPYNRGPKSAAAGKPDAQRSADAPDAKPDRPPGGRGGRGGFHKNRRRGRFYDKPNPPSAGGLSNGSGHPKRAEEVQPQGD